MFANVPARAARAALVALAAVLLVAPARAQQPTPGALAAARELMEIKGAKNMLEPVVLGIVEQARVVILQTNPSLAQDLDEVSAQLRTEYAPRTGPSRRMETGALAAVVRDALAALGLTVRAALAKLQSAQPDYPVRVRHEAVEFGADAPQPFEVIEEEIRPRREIDRGGVGVEFRALAGVAG